MNSIEIWFRDTYAEHRFQKAERIPRIQRLIELRSVQFAELQEKLFVLLPLASIIVGRTEYELLFDCEGEHRGFSFDAGDRLHKMASEIQGEISDTEFHSWATAFANRPVGPPLIAVAIAFC